MANEITQDSIRALVESFSKTIYRSRDAEPGTLSHDVMEKCLYLFKLDYTTVEISNHGGELSAHYPHLIIIPENEKNKNDSFTPPPLFGTPSNRTQTIYENSYDPVKLRELINKSRFARSRTRFPVPVIMYRGKYVCRSSTLSCGPEMYTRSGINYFFIGSPATASSPVDDLNTDGNCALEIEWLLAVTSSEKVDKERRYQEFTICSLPYPGCEFFRQFRDNDYTHENLVFDWSQTHVNAVIGIPADNITLPLHFIGWDQYKSWDLAKITQNYIKLLLKYLQDQSSGLLIHCISGWDRTPLFVSLLRLLLWADGAIHQLLTVEQVLFLTIAYDWYLFGHDLPDRLSKGEEIFVFCFYVLKHLIPDEFSTIPRFTAQRTKNNSSSSSSIMVLDASGGSSGGGGGGVGIEHSDIEFDESNDSQEFQQKINEEITNGNFASLAMNTDSNSSVEILSEAPPQSPPQAHSNSYSPLPKRKTSPVTVPLSSKSHQRHESTSSVGSWQMVNQSGSLRSTDSDTHRHRLNSTVESNVTSNDEDSLPQRHQAALARRRERLSALRVLFYNCYCTSVGFKYKNHTEKSFAAMWTSIAEIVGLVNNS